MLWQGTPIGSCTYSDFCRDVVQDICEINTSNCSPELDHFGIDCSCPFDIPAQTYDETYSFDLPDFSSSIIAPCPFFFQLTGVSGDFDVKMTLNDASNQHVACFRFLYTMTKA